MQNGKRRLLSELKKLQKDPPQHFRAEPLEENIFEWHFTILGPEDSDFEGGVYHGKLKLPPEYPMKPPKIILLTPQGRWKINSKICLSISDFHPETWQPSWGIRTALTALRAFMPTPGKGAIGSLDASSGARKVLAQRSEAWKCSQCGACMRDVKKDLEEIQRLACTPVARDSIPTFDALPPEALKTTKPPTIVEDEDLVLDQKASEPEELEEEDDGAEPEIAPVEHMEEAEEPEVPPEPVATPPPGVATRVSSEPEHDTLNSAILILMTIIGSILVKKLLSAFAQAL
jgi:ubiquitin-conjugating enzyme E2 J1